MYTKHAYWNLYKANNLIIRFNNFVSYLFVGDVNSGKSVLIDKLCQISKSFPIGGKFPLSCCSLEYRFIDVQDEETDGVCIGAHCGLAVGDVV